MQILINLYITILGKVPVIILIITAAVSVIVGDYAAKEWSINQKSQYLLIALLGYFFSGFFYIPTLLREGLIVTSIIWVLISTIGFLLIGFVIYKETFSITQTIAIVIGVICILVLTIFD